MASEKIVQGMMTNAQKIFVVRLCCEVNGSSPAHPCQAPIYSEELQAAPSVDGVGLTVNEESLKTTSVKSPIQQHLRKAPRVCARRTMAHHAAIRAVFGFGQQADRPPAKS
jgi:hypothetical protein